MRRSITGILAVAFICHGSLAGADDQQEVAKKHFLTGVEHIKNNDCKKAVIALESAVEIMPLQNAYYNLGKCYEKLKEAIKALKAYENLLKKFKPEDIDDATKQDVTHRAEALQKSLGSVMIKVSPDKTNIFVNDVLVGTSPLIEPVLLKPGKYIVRMEKEGYETIKTQVEVFAEASTNLSDVALVPKKPSAPADQQPTESTPSDTPPPDVTGPVPPKADTTPPSKATAPPPTKRGKGMLISGIITGTLGVAGVALGAVFTKKGYDDRDALEEASTGRKEDFDTLDQEKLPLDKTMTLVGFIAGGTLLATSLTLILIDAAKNKRLKNTQKEQAHFTLTSVRF